MKLPNLIFQKNLVLLLLVWIFRSFVKSVGGFLEFVRTLLIWIRRWPIRWSIHLVMIIIIMAKIFMLADIWVTFTLNLLLLLLQVAEEALVFLGILFVRGKLNLTSLYIPLLLVAVIFACFVRAVFWCILLTFQPLWRIAISIKKVIIFNNLLLAILDIIILPLIINILIILLWHISLEMIWFKDISTLWITILNRKLLIIRRLSTMKSIVWLVPQRWFHKCEKSLFILKHKKN